MIQMKRQWRSLMMTSRSKPAHLLILLVLVLLWMTSIPSHVLAWDACPQIVDAIPLVPEIAETTSTEIGHDFYTTTLSFQFSDGMQAVLSSSPDGQGQVSTDDQFLIQASPSGRAWSHDFRNPARTQIVPLPAQDISRLFVVGKNTITVKVTDLFVPNYSTRPYFLILIKKCATPTATFTPLPTVTPTPVPPTPTVAATTTPVVQLIVVAVTPSDTPIPLPTATVISATPTSRLEPGATLAPAGNRAGFMANVAWWMLVGFLLSFSGTGLWWLAFRQRKRLTGEIDVYQDEAYVTTYVLSNFHQPVITIGKHGTIVLPGLIEEGVVARIVAAVSAKTTPSVPSIEVLNTDDHTWSSHQLTDGYILTASPYRLTYRSYQPERTDHEEETYA